MATEPRRTQEPGMQHPLMEAHDGGAEDAVLAWEGRAQLDIAVMIERYLTENPPPGQSHHPRHYRAWTADLRTAGEVRLAAARARRLRVA